MNAPSQTNLYFINWVKRAALCLFSAFPSVFAPSLFMWVWAFDRKKNAKTVGRERKTGEKTHNQLPGFELALLRQLLASRAGNLTTHAAKETKYKIRFISENYVTIT